MYPVPRMHVLQATTNVPENRLSSVERQPRIVLDERKRIGCESLVYHHILTVVVVHVRSQTSALAKLFIKREQVSKDGRRNRLQDEELVM